MLARVFGGLAGAVVLFFLNYGLFEGILIPDPCYYHTQDSTWMFQLFYTLDSCDGGHPFPTILNLVLTLCIGFFIGWLALKTVGPYWVSGSKKISHE